MSVPRIRESFEGETRLRTCLVSSASLVLEKITGVWNKLLHPHSGAPVIRPQLPVQEPWMRRKKAINKSSNKLPLQVKSVSEGKTSKRNIKPKIKDQKSDNYTYLQKLPNLSFLCHPPNTISRQNCMPVLGHLFVYPTLRLMRPPGKSAFFSIKMKLEHHKLYGMLLCLVGTEKRLSTPFLIITFQLKLTLNYIQ